MAFLSKKRVLCIFNSTLWFAPGATGYLPSSWLPIFMQLQLGRSECAHNTDNTRNTDNDYGDHTARLLHLALTVSEFYYSKQKNKNFQVSALRYHYEHREILLKLDSRGCTQKDWLVYSHSRVGKQEAVARLGGLA